MRNKPLSHPLVRDMACPQLMVGSTGESLFWILHHSSGCTLPTHSRLTKTCPLAPGAEGCSLAQWYKAKRLELLASHSWGPGKLAFGCSLDPHRNSKAVWPRICLRSMCNHPCTGLNQNGVVGRVVGTYCSFQPLGMRTFLVGCKILDVYSTFLFQFYLNRLVWAA